MYWCLFIVKIKLKKGIRGEREREGGREAEDGKWVIFFDAHNAS
jgi:hypothetical protein